MTLTKTDIENLADLHYEADTYETPDQRLFALLVDVADVYLQDVERRMPSDTAESPFIGGVMPIQAVVWGLEENLEMRQESGSRINDG
jgi:hypothetical protein